MKKIIGFIKLQIPAGQANPAPPVGPALGQKGVNIMEFCKQFNARTQAQAGLIIPVVITVFSDKSFTFVTKTPPAAVLLAKAAKIEKGSAEPNRNKVGKVTKEAGPRDRGDEDARPECATIVEAAMSMVAGHGTQHGHHRRGLTDHTRGSSRCRRGTPAPLQGRNHENSKRFKAVGGEGGRAESRIRSTRRSRT